MTTSAAATPEFEGVNPADPILASTLLDLEAGLREPTVRAPVWLTGVKSLDSRLPERLWTAGKVIGLICDQGLPNVSSV